MSIIRKHDITLCGGNEEYKIVLCPLSDEHLPDLYKWNSDPEVLFWTEGEDIEGYPPEVVHQIYGGISQDNLCFAIKVNDEIIGECWLQKMNLPGVIKINMSMFCIAFVKTIISVPGVYGKRMGSSLY